jgi:hypothetical protein
MMNISKMLVIGFMVISGCMDANSIMAADMPQGRIHFSENSDGGGDTCSLPASVKDFYKMQYHGCKNDQMTYFYLDNVASATTIRFESERCEGTTQEWNFEIKTIVHPITTRRISFFELRDAAVGSIVVKGVVLVSKKTDTSVPIKGKLSCVRTTPSAQP